MKLRFWLLAMDVLAPLYWRTRRGSVLGRPYLFAATRAMDVEFSR